MITVTQKVHFSRSKAGRRRLTDKPVPTQVVSPGRVPRISKMMALAIHFDGLLRGGRVKDLTEIAQLTMVTQPRITQIMNLLHLAPDIQEALLFLPRVIEGRAPIHERHLRPLCAESDWRQQRQLWQTLKCKVLTELCA